MKPWGSRQLLSLAASISFTVSSDSAFAFRNRGMSSTTGITSPQRSFPVYPLSHREKLQSEHPDLHFKTLHVVRHAEGHHNVNKEYRHIKNLDARLTDIGKQQCRALAQTAQPLLQNAQLVVTSPMTRCVETAMLCFPFLLQKRTPFVAHEMIRETVNYACDRRRRISELQKEFPEIDYSHVESDHDEIWEHYHAKLGDPNTHDSHRESAQLYQVAERGRRFMEWLGQRKEQEIVVCTHSAFLRCFKSWGHKGGVPMMPEQHLDDRGADDIVDHPVLEYQGQQDKAFEEYMRATYENCELRSFLVAFESDTRRGA